MLSNVKVFSLFRYYCLQIFPWKKSMTLLPLIVQIWTPGFTQECLCHVELKLSPRFWRFFFKSSVIYFNYFAFYLPWQKSVINISLVQIWIAFTQGCLCQDWLILALWLRRRFLNACRQCIFSIISPCKSRRTWSFICTNYTTVMLNSLFRCGWNWPTCSSGKGENMKRQTDNGRQVIIWAFISARWAKMKAHGMIEVYNICTWKLNWSRMFI